MPNGTLRILVLTIDKFTLLKSLAIVRESCNSLKAVSQAY